MEKESIGRKTAFLGMAVALALIVSYVESLIPFPVGIPGAKLGLTNIVILIVLYQRGFHDAVLVSVVRIVAAGFLFGNLSAILYSLAGAAASLCVMQLLKRAEDQGKGFSMVGVSIAGGAAHNLGQLVIAVCVVENGSLFYYLPFLIVAGVVTGMCIGVAAREILKRL